jgi:hypothetical protein
MTQSSGSAPLTPGFEFLHSLVKSAGAALPGIGQWVVPTLDAAELEKRIQELQTVQFWLDQNSRMLTATIQAMEVQRMTLSTLKTMNVQMDDLRKSMQAQAPDAPTATQKTADEPTNESTNPAPGLVDPLKWWGDLTQQFTDLASSVVKDSAIAPAVAAASTQAGSAKTAPKAAPKAASKAAVKKPQAAKTATKAASKPAFKSKPTGSS